MLEGDEILESAQETGYRLCRVFRDKARPSSPSQLLQNKKLYGPLLGDRIRQGRTVATLDDDDPLAPVIEGPAFSAIWDTNNHKRLFICAQNGLLKEIELANANDIESTRSIDYQIYFRRFVQNYDPSDHSEKLVSQHWDKMVTIPGRPNELIFLLGVSRSILYTSLPAREETPYPSKPVLSSLTRTDFRGFIYGTPVMQIGCHSSRVTALSVSPKGQLLASGDETGKVRIILLLLLDAISGAHDPTSTKLENSSFGLPAHRQFKPSYEITHKMHTGPIFSLAWLPMAHAIGEHSIYSLVTGSADRAVRLWRVDGNAVSGVALSPLMVLDTLSTHILCLSSIRPPQADTIENDFEAEPLPGKDLYISAGTNVGTVHVWKISAADITEALLDPVLKQGESSVADLVNERKNGKTEAEHFVKSMGRDTDGYRKNLLVDDGSYLLALLQPTDQPVINVSLAPLSATMKSLSHFSGNVVLAASDTNGSISLHAADLVMPTMLGSSAVSASFLSDDEHIRQLKKKYFNAVRFASTQRILTEEEGNKEGFVPIKEEQFDAQVVSCQFSWGPNAELAVCTMDGKLRVYNDLEVPTSDDDYLLTDLASASTKKSEDGLSFSPASKASAAFDSEEEEEDDNDPPPPPPPPPSSRSQGYSSPAKQSAPGYSSPTKQSGVKANTASNSSAFSPLKASQERSSSNRPLTPKSSQRSVLSAAAGARVASEARLGQDSSKSAVAVEFQGSRKYSPSSHSTSPNRRISVASSEELEPRPRSLAPEPMAEGLQPSASPKRAAISEGSRVGRTTATTTTTSAIGTSQKRVGLLTNRSASKVIVSSKTEKTKYQIDSQSAPNPIPADSSADPAAPSPADEEEGSVYFQESQELHIQLKQIDSSNRRRPPYSNSLANPGLQSARVLEHNLVSASQAVIDEDVSVTTINTSQSDRLRAIKEVTAGVPRSTSRYSSLTTGHFLDSQDVSELIKSAAPNQFVAKPHQADALWAAKKKALAPKEEDLKIFSYPDPKVSLSFISSEGDCCDAASVQDNGNKMSYEERIKYNRRYGLHSWINKESHLPEYALEINSDDIFGEIDLQGNSRSETASAIEAAMEEFRVQSLMSLVYM